MTEPLMGFLYFLKIEKCGAATQDASVGYKMALDRDCIWYILTFD